MAIARIQAVSANANNAALTSTNPNDLIVVFAYSDGTAAVPSLASGFTSLQTGSSGGAVKCGFILGYMLSAGGDTSTGTWTGATQVTCIVFRGVDTTTPVGASAKVVGSTSTTLSYPALTLQITTGTSWVFGGGGATAATSGMNGNAGVLANQTSVTIANALDTNGGVASFAAQSLTTVGTTKSCQATCEIRQGAAQFTAADAPTTAESAATGPNSFVRATTDALATSESAVVGPNVLILTATESLATSESASGTRQIFYKLLQETGSFLLQEDGTSHLLIEPPSAVVPPKTGTATDAPHTAEVASRTGSFQRTVADAPTTAEVASRTASIIRSASESLTTAEVASRAQALARTATESLTTSELATRISVQSRSATDAPTTSESATRTGSFVRSATDAPTTSESATSTRVFARSATDTPTTSESASRTGSFKRSATDAPTTSEVASRAVVAARTAT